MRHTPVSNMFFAAINKVIGIVGPFVIRTIIIYRLGNEYVGLNSLFTSILLVLNLAELGFGAALTYSMYKPVNDGDIGKLSALLNYYRKIYRIVGVLILSVGLAFSPFLNLLIKGEYPKGISIEALFVIYLINTSLSYVLFAYKSSILIAYRQNDLVYLVQGFTQFFMYVFQALALLCVGNFYVYAIMMPIFTIVNNVIVYAMTNHLYPNITLSGQLDKVEKDSIFGRVKALFVHRCAGVLIAALDSVFVSAFLGLVELALFTNYYYIVNALNGMIEMMTSSIVSTIGNDLISLSDKKNYTKFCTYTKFLTIGIGLITVCLYNMLQPFIALWIGSDGVLPKSTLLLFCIYFYSWRVRSIGQVYRDAAGIWQRDVFKSVIGIVLNIILNYVLIMTIGVNGALLSTIVIMLFIFLPWETRIVVLELFHCKPYRYIRIMTVNTFLTAVSMFASSFIIGGIMIRNSILDLIVRFVISIIISCVILMMPNVKSRELRELCPVHKKRNKNDK